MESTASHPLTIDEVARQTGTTTRNIRAHQSRGLLPPPRLVGRVGYYGREHLERLRLITELQERGFSLAAIASLVEASERGASLKQVLGLEQALTASWSDEEPEILSDEELAEVFAGSLDDLPLLERAIDLGLVTPVGAGRYRVDSPRLLRQGQALVAAGVPLGVVLEEGAALRADTERMAARFVDMFVRYVWAPRFKGRAPSPLGIDDLTAVVRRLRVLGFESVAVFLAQAMERATTAALADPGRQGRPHEELTARKSSGAHDRGPEPTAKGDPG